MDKTFEVYKITNTINNKIYVGITNQGFKTRWYKHCSDSIRECGFPLHLSMRKHGIANFTIEVIDTAKDYIELKDKEKYWIKELKSNNRSIGYNLTEGGDGTTNRICSPETRQKLSEKATGRKWSKEFSDFAKINGVYGKSVRQYDLNNNLLNIFVSASFAARELNITARNISDACRGKLKTYKGFIWEYSNEPKTKVLFDNLNKIVKEKKVMPDEVKQRISDTNKLRWTEERKVKQSVNNHKNMPILQYTLDGEFIKEFYNVSQVVKELGLTTHTNVAKCARGIRKKAAGYVWKYKQ